MRRLVRLAPLAQLLERSFWVMPGGMVALAVVAGVVIPLIERSADLSLAPLSFDVAPSTAEQMLGAIATGTLSAAGVAFSVVVVALQLASQQFSPRVLQTYRRRTLNQITLGSFLGTATFSLLVLRVVAESPPYVPELSVLLALGALIAAAGLFVAFVAEIVRMTEVSAVIHRIALQAGLALDKPFPTEGGHPPGARRAAVLAEAERRMAGPARDIRSPRAGFIESLDVEAVVEAAARTDGFVEQCVPVGEFMLSGGLLARAWAPEGAGDELAAAVVDATLFGEERTVARDLPFALRQLADVAVKALSPALNDPTTAENSIDAAAEILVEHARRGSPDPLRCDDEGRPRLMAKVVEFDRLVRLAFDQVRIYGARDPALCRRLLALLARVRGAVDESSTAEIDRQARLVRDSAREAAALPEDAETVAVEYARLFAGAGDERGAGAMLS